MSLPSIEESLLIAGHIDVRLHRNGLSIRSDDTVPINQDAPVLIMVHCCLYWNSRLIMNVIESGECLHDGKIPRVVIIRIRHPAKQDGDVVGGSRVLAKNIFQQWKSLVLIVRVRMTWESTKGSRPMMPGSSP
jgi:hypothetical protein